MLRFAIHRLIYALWIVQPVLHAALAWMLYRRKLIRDLPIFFAYNILLVPLHIARFVARNQGYSAYFYTYWFTEPAIILLVFGNIYELFRSMFRQREGLKDFGTMLFRWALIVMLLMAVVQTAYSAGQPDRHPYLKLMMNMERSTQLMMVGLLLFLFLFATHLGISRRHRIFALVIGWGVLSSVELIIYTQGWRFMSYKWIFDTIQLSAYVIALVIWIWSVVVRDPAEILPNMLLRSQRWNEALMESPQLDEQPTLLLGIESIVDRALNRAAENPTERQPR